MIILNNDNDGATGMNENSFHLLEFEKFLSVLYDKNKTVKHVRYYIGKLLDTHKTNSTTLVYEIYKWIGKSIDNNKNNRISTLRRQIPEPFRTLIGFAGDINTCLTTEGEWEDLYIEIAINIDDRKGLKVLNDAFNIIKKFHKHLVKNNKYVPNVDFTDVYDVANGLRNPNVNVITRSEYEIAFHYFIELYKLGDIQSRICAEILCLAYNLGLRRYEVGGLLIKNYHFGASPLLYIEENKNRVLKTFNAERAFPLNLFLNEEELSFFDSYYDNRCTEITGYIYDKPLFQDINSTKTGFVKEGIFKKITTVLQMVTGDSRIRFQHLRHSFATRTMMYFTIRIDQHGNVDDRFCDWIDVNRIMQFRREYFPSTVPHDPQLVNNAAWQLARLLGHASPRVSFMHYIHVYDILRLDGITPLSRTGLSVTTVESILDIKSSQRSNLGLVKNQNGEISLKSVLKELRKKISFATIEDIPHIHPYLEAVNNVEHPVRNVSVDTIFRLLGNIQSKDESCLTCEEISWRTTFQNIASDKKYVTKQKRLRFPLIPQLPKQINHYLEARSLIHKILFSLTSTHFKALIKEWTVRYLTKITKNETGFMTSSLDEAREYLVFLQSLGITDTCLKIKHYPNPTFSRRQNQIRYWCLGLKVDKKQFHSYQNGRLSNNSRYGMISIIVTNMGIPFLKSTSTTSSPAWPFAMQLLAAYFRLPTMKECQYQPISV